MPLTELGYERPTYEDLLERQIERAKLLFGDDINTNANTPLGKYIRLNCTDLAEVFEDMERIYYSRFPNTATGVSLDRLCPFAGISRNQPTSAQHAIRFIGTPNEYVPEGFEVSTANGEYVFHTYSSYLIGEDGTVDGVVYCEQAGAAGNVDIGRIDTIVNPDVNIESIEHLSVLVEGTDLETDPMLRNRFNITINGAGSTTVAAIRAAILRVPQVSGAEIVENDTHETVNGLPPHSFECYVLAPETQDTLVAEAIYSKKTAGIKAVGNVSVNILDEDGVTRAVAFSRTIKKHVYVKVTIETNSNFAAEGVDAITNNIANSINQLRNGENVYFSSMYPCIFSVTGVVNVKSIALSEDGKSYAASDISVEAKEVARIELADIEVTIV